MNHPYFPPVSLLCVQQQGLHCFSHSNFASLRGRAWMMSPTDGRTLCQKKEKILARPSKLETEIPPRAHISQRTYHIYMVGAPSAPRAKAHAILLALCALQAFGVLCGGVKTQSLPARRQGIACQKQKARALENHTTCFILFHRKQVQTNI